MPTELYIEALLADELFADCVWDLWDQTRIDDKSAKLAWIFILDKSTSSPYNQLI